MGKGYRFFLKSMVQCFKCLKSVIEKVEIPRSFHGSFFLLESKKVLTEVADG